jgi:hypothetical protein
MNDVDTIDGAVKRAKRRKNSAQFKAEVLEACQQPDASAAAIREAVQPERKRSAPVARRRSQAAAQMATEVPILPTPAFIALDVQQEAGSPARDARV